MHGSSVLPQCTTTFGAALSWTGRQSLEAEKVPLLSCGKSSLYFKKKNFLMPYRDNVKATRRTPRANLRRCYEDVSVAVHRAPAMRGHQRAAKLRTDCF